MTSLFNNAESANYADVKAIMENIEDYQKLCETCAAEMSAMREDSLHRLELCELTEEEILETAKRIRSCSIRRRAYKDEIARCKSVQACGFYLTADENEKLRRFRGAIANTNKTLANRLYTPRIDRDIWGLSEKDFTEMVLRKMKFTDHKYVDRSGKLRTVYKPHKRGIDKLMEMIRKEEEE